MVTVEPVTKYRRPSRSRAETTKWSRSDCSMGQPPRRLLFDLPLVPLWMNGAQMAEQHPARTREHAAGDREPFGSRLQTKRGRHLIVDDFNAQVGERHG